MPKRKMKKYIVIGPRLKWGGAGGAMNVMAQNAPEAKRKALKTFKQYNPQVKGVRDLEARSGGAGRPDNTYGFYQRRKKSQRRK